MADLQAQYPWTQLPLVVGAPMRLIALSQLAYQISRAGGLGFIGAGNDVSTLDNELEQVRQLCDNDSILKQYREPLPVGVGFLVWAGNELLQDAIPILKKHKPAAIWLFAPRQNDELVTWSKETRRATDGKSKIWIQVGSVSEAVDVATTCQPDTIVIQGTDAGGHGLHQCAGLMSLLPEADDAISKACSEAQIRKPDIIAAGGIVEARGVAAALSLGASGVVMGTRYLASQEANIAAGYQDAVLQASDGGMNTARSKLYDTLRGTTDWPAEYGGRGVLNESWYDARDGMDIEKNKKLYEHAVKSGDEGWGEQGRLCTYAGTGVGLVQNVKGAAEITIEVREGVQRVLNVASKRAPLLN